MIVVTTYVRDAAAIAESLRLLAGLFADLDPLEIGEVSVELDVQITGSGSDTEDERCALADRLCKQLFGIDAEARDTLYGTPTCGHTVGCIAVDIYTGIKTARERALVAEVAELRAKLAEANPTCT